MDIYQMGWILNRRPGNAGGVGNTLEDLLGIRENNLPIPNADEWELKAQRRGTDFDARTGHNHGTKFRLRQDCLPELYENIETIL